MPVPISLFARQEKKINRNCLQSFNLNLHESGAYKYWDGISSTSFIKLVIRIFFAIQQKEVTFLRELSFLWNYGRKSVNVL